MKNNENNDLEIIQLSKEEQKESPLSTHGQLNKKTKSYSDEIEYRFLSNLVKEREKKNKKKVQSLVKEFIPMKREET